MTDKITINYLNGTERELLMSYGLINQLSLIVVSPEVAPSIAVDVGLRNEVLAAVLAERKPTGKVLKEVEDVDDLGLSIEEIERVIDWATEAILGFFVRSLEKMVKRVEKNQDAFAGLKSSMAGLQASISATA